jgi:hypothetical protein
LLVSDINLRNEGTAFCIQVLEQIVISGRQVPFIFLVVNRRVNASRCIDSRLISKFIIYNKQAKMGFLFQLERLVASGTGMNCMSSVDYFGNLVCYVMIFGILDLQGEASQVALTWSNWGRLHQNFQVYSISLSV